MSPPPLPPLHDTVWTECVLRLLVGCAPLLTASLACTLLVGFVLFMVAEAVSETLEQFTNADIVAANERVVLISPFDSDDDSNRWSPALADTVQQLW